MLRNQTGLAHRGAGRRPLTKRDRKAAARGRYQCGEGPLTRKPSLDENHAEAQTSGGFILGQKRSRVRAVIVSVRVHFIRKPSEAHYNLGSLFGIRNPKTSAPSRRTPSHYATQWALYPNPAKRFWRLNPLFQPRSIVRTRTRFSCRAGSYSVNSQWDRNIKRKKTKKSRVTANMPQTSFICMQRWIDSPRNTLGLRRPSRE